MCRPELADGLVHIFSQTSIKLMCCIAQAREAYEKGLELEPDDRAMQEARHKANVNERKAMDMHQHRFKRREPGAGAGNKQQAKQQQQQSKKPRVQAAAGVRNQAMLSFGDDNEEDS